MANTQTTKAAKTQASIAATLLTSAELNAVIASIARRGKQLDKDMHNAAVSALHQAHVHKNASPAMKLLDAMPASARKGALRKWLFDFGPFVMKEDNKTMGVDATGVKPWAEVEAQVKSLPFWKHTADKDEVQFIDAMEAVRGLIARLTKAKQNGKLKPEDEAVLTKLGTVAPAVIEAHNA